MGVTALVMAGGKGNRMALNEEKPLLQVGGKPMIEHILNALKNAEKVDAIVVTVSRHTPKTARFVESLSVKVLETPGNGYVADVGYAVIRLKLGTVLTISADLPLVTGDIINNIIERYIQFDKPALAVFVLMETKEKLGLGGEYIIEVGNKRLVPAGINLIDGRRIGEKELEEEKYVVDKEEVAMNVNTPQDLQVAEHLFEEKLHRKKYALKRRKSLRNKILPCS